LRTGTGSHEQSVGHVDDNEIVDPQAGDEPSRLGHDYTTSNLLGEDCSNNMNIFRNGLI
jgi:hypothetical protein